MSVTLLAKTSCMIAILPVVPKLHLTGCDSACSKSLKCASVSQVFAKNLTSPYRSTKRRRSTSWFAQTAPSSLWCERADRRNTAPASVRSKKTSSAGERHSFFFLFFPPAFLKLQDLVSLLGLVAPSSAPPALLPPPPAVLIHYLHIFVVYHSVIAQRLPVCFQQGFQLSSAQQEMPLASLRPLQPRCAEAGRRQLYSV